MSSSSSSSSSSSARSSAPASSAPASSSSRSSASASSSSSSSANAPTVSTANFSSTLWSFSQPPSSSSSSSHFSGFGGGGDDYAGDGDGDEDEVFFGGSASAASSASDDFFQFNNKDSVIFAIDCSEAMFQPLDNGEIPFAISLLCAKNVLANKIVASDKDLVGIVFYSTKSSKNMNNFKHVHILQELDTPDVRRILELEQMVDQDQDFQLFDKNFGRSATASVHDLLWVCLEMFSNSATKVGSKRVLIFTNQDDPCGADVSSRRQALLKAKDLHQNLVEIEVLPLGKKSGEKFDLSKFFKDVVQVADESDESLAAAADASQSLSSLLDKMRRKTFKKRALMKIPLILGDGVQLGVCVYNLCSETKKGGYVWLHAKSNKEIKTVSKLVCEDTATLLMPSDIKHFFPYGGEKVVFETSEVKEIRKFGVPGLVLMGFKPRAALKAHYNVKTSNFLYPDETVVEGSTVLFNALLQELSSRDRIAICRFIPRVNAAPRFAALLPQMEVLNSDKMQVQPPGFHVIHLPFADDLRSLDYEQHSMADKNLTSIAMDIVKELSFDFTSWDFENPNLQKHYRNLEALALNRDVPDDFVDTIVPDLAGMEERAGKLFDKFKEAAFPPDYNPDTAGSKPRPKRKAEGDEPAKRVKLEEGELPDVEKMYESHTLESLTIPILKTFLKTVNAKVSSSMKKADLIAAVEKHFGKKG